MAVYNFSAGPALLPEAVLQQAQAEMCDYQGSGLSVMSISHRSELFLDILRRAENDLRELLDVPSHYRILFLQGGASAQFVQIVLNLAGGFRCINAVVSGYWSAQAYRQMRRFGGIPVDVAADGIADYGGRTVPPPENWRIHPKAAFVHYTANETVNGLQYPLLPQPAADSPPFVCDMSSELLSRPINVADFGLIYAGAQKNIGPAGLTVVIIREDLVGRCGDGVPDVWSYRAHLDRQGMYNTPPTYAVYLAGLVLQWLKRQGGIAWARQAAEEKAALLYAAIDGSGGFYRNRIAPQARSLMNVVFDTGDAERDAAFVRSAQRRGLHFLAGHRAVGGLRASLYNAMPCDGVYALIDFMDEFKRRYGR